MTTLSYAELTELRDDLKRTRDRLAGLLTREVNDIGELDSAWVPEATALGAAVAAITQMNAELAALTPQDATPPATMQIGSHTVEVPPPDWDGAQSISLRP